MTSWGLTDLPLQIDFETKKNYLMAKNRLSKIAKSDLIRIHHYGVEKFGIQH